MTDRNTKVEIVIPVHNRRDTTLQALRSLSRIDRSGLDVHIIIVDDGSTDGTTEAIGSSFPNVQILKGDGTLHYAGGTNLGIVTALKNLPDFIVTANDDSIFHESFLQRLITTARENHRSIVGALLLLWNDPHRVFQVGFKWETVHGGWQQNEGISAFELSRSPFEVEGLAGNCVLIPAPAIRECGLMNAKEFPFGWGDIQWFVRMRKHEWRLMVDPTAMVWCEPNTNPPPLHTLPLRKALRLLFSDRRHPLNLQRQFIARWQSAPSKISALAAYAIYLGSLARKALTGPLKRDRHA